MEYVFAEMVLDTDRYLLQREGEQVHVEPQVFDVLCYLAENRERIVSREELLDEIWGDRFVAPATLTSRIKEARHAIGDDGTRQDLIETVRGRGFRFVADVEVRDAGRGSPTPTPLELDQQIGFCTTDDGVHLAYATIGSGPPLVRAAHWITHLDYDWRSPVWRHWLEGLARGRTLIRYDERGCGLSDHDPAEMSLNAFVRDLEAVVDELQLDRFPLIGLSQGGAVAVTYAHRHPEHVSHLVLVGAYPQGRWVRASDEETKQAAELELEMVRLGWGRDDPSFRRFFIERLIPDASTDLWEAFAELLRRTTSATSAARILETTSHFDVTKAASELEVPTLILHAHDEIQVPFEQATMFAKLIRGSHLVALESSNHLMRPEEPAWAHFLAELDAFLSRTPS